MITALRQLRTSLVTRSLLGTAQRWSSSKGETFESAPIRISVTDDGKTIVCWHPEQQFPYEHSKPMPKMISNFVETDSVLKMDLREDTDLTLNKKDLTTEELIRLTYMPRNYWSKWDKKQKPKIKHPNPPVDRIGI